MTSVMQRQRSRRHLAALTFLSNISLDGTHRDTHLLYCGHRGLLGRPPCPSQGRCPAGAQETNHCAHAEKKGFSNSNMMQPVDASSSIGIPAIHSISSIARGRITGEAEGEHQRRRTTSCVTSMEKSSNELALIPGRTRRTSGSMIETSYPPKEVKFMSRSNSRKLREERVVLLTGGKVPIHLFSSIPYNRTRSDHTHSTKGEGPRRRYMSGTRPLSPIGDNTDPTHIIGMAGSEDQMEVSYADLLVPSRSLVPRPSKQVSEEPSDGGDRLQHPAVVRCFSYEYGAHKASVHYPQHGMHASLHEEPRAIGPPCYPGGAQYTPNTLDDPELWAGKHRKLLRFPSYMTSVIDYTKPSDLKTELNDKFREKFPYIQLTLSKMRSLKREMLKIGVQEGGVDLVTVAQAYVYFERLILHLLINKQNRKLVAGACLLLSAKMNDVKGEMLTHLIEKTETTFRLNRRDLLQWEFACLVALEFGLHVPAWQVLVHYQRLLCRS